MTCSAILIPLLWSIATMAATRKLATGAAAPARVKKKTEKLPASGKPKKLDVFMKRSCLEQLYELDPALDEVGNRNKIRAICSSCGMHEKFMVAERKKLPAGLVNNAESRTLRRAVNKLCGIKGDRQRWTQAELKIAVLGVVNDGASFRGTMAEYGIGPDCLNKHRKALLNHRKVGGTDDSYFAQDLTAGRPQTIKPDHEAVAASIMDQHGCTGIGKDYQRTKKYLSDLGTAQNKATTGKPVKASQSLVRGFMNRNNMSAQKASDLSQVRAESLTPEKHHTMFNTYAEGLEALRKMGRFAKSMVPGMPDSDTLYNSDEMSPGSMKYGKIIVRMTGARRRGMRGRRGKAMRMWRLKTGEHAPFQATAFITVRADGTFVKGACGVVHAGAPPGNASFSIGLPNRSGIHMSKSGYMDEVGFYKMAEKFIAAVGKEDWDCTAAWNKQPAQHKHSFEARPVIWLLDGHYSHLFGKALRLLKEHDVHVFFTASGSSEIDQVADCGVMAHLQGSFADAMADHLAANPGIPFLPCHWNMVYAVAIDQLTRNGGKAITSAWECTGWFPYNPMASNYHRDVYKGSTFIDPRGGERLIADTAQAASDAGATILRPISDGSSTLYRMAAAAPDRSLLIDHAAAQFFREVDDRAGQGAEGALQRDRAGQGGQANQGGSGANGQHGGISQAQPHIDGGMGDEGGLLRRV